MQLRARAPAAPPRIRVELTDALMVSYEFLAYPIDERIDVENAVYAFAHNDGSDWVIHYIRGARSLPQQLASDPKREPARWEGATHVLVHVPGLEREIKFREAEMRLVHAYKPPMNRSYRTRFGWRQ